MKALVIFAFVAAGAIIAGLISVALKHVLATPDDIAWLIFILIGLPIGVASAAAGLVASGRRP